MSFPRIEDFPESTLVDDDQIPSPCTISARSQRRGYAVSSRQNNNVSAAPRGGRSLDPFCQTAPLPPSLLSANRGTTHDTNVAQLSSLGRTHSVGWASDVGGGTSGQVTDTVGGGLNRSNCHNLFIRNLPLLREIMLPLDHPSLARW